MTITAEQFRATLNNQIEGLRVDDKEKIIQRVVGRVGYSEAIVSSWLEGIETPNPCFFDTILCTVGREIGRLRRKARLGEDIRSRISGFC